MALLLPFHCSLNGALVLQVKCLAGLRKGLCAVHAIANAVEVVSRQFDIASGISCTLILTGAKLESFLDRKAFQDLGNRSDKPVGQFLSLFLLADGKLPNSIRRIGWRVQLFLLESSSERQKIQVSRPLIVIDEYVRELRSHTLHAASASAASGAGRLVIQVARSSTALRFAWRSSPRA